MPLKESFKKRFDNSLRVASVASLAFAPYAPVFSSQEKAQSTEREGHTLALDTPLNSNGIPPLETSDGRRVVFASPEIKEQQEKESVWFGGIWARFNEKGQIVISTPWNKAERVHLEPYILLRGGVLSLSPDGKKVAVALHSRIGTRAYPQVFVLDTFTGQGDLLFSPELIVRGMTAASFYWSADSQKVAAIVTNFNDKKELGIFQADTREMLINLRGVTSGAFSPDSNQFAVQIGKNLQVINLQDGEQTTLEDVSRFSWSKDGSILVLNACTQWVDSKELGPTCLQGRLALFNIKEKSRISLRERIDPGSFPFISPNNTKILLLRQTSNFAIFDISSGGVTPVNFLRGNTPIRFGWDWDFWDNERILFRKLDPLLGGPDLIWVDARTGETRAVQQVTTVRDEDGRVIKVFPGYILSEVTNTRTGKSSLYLQEIPSDGNRAIRGREVASLDSAEETFNPYSGRWVFGILKEGGQVTGSRGNFLFLGDKLHKIENEEVLEYFGGTAGPFPEVLTNFIPEGEKISFRPGDAVGDGENKEFGIWYLRNGKRYKVQNWEWFLKGHRLPPETKPTQVDKAILERIPEGEPTLVQKEGELGWLDWDGNFVEFQPYGGRMIIFIGGYGGSTPSQMEAFRQIKEKLVEKGWRKTQFLEATYNIDIDALHRGEIKPKEYKAEDTKVDPMLSASKLQLQIRRYKEMLPLTRFIFMGHSLGGLEGTEAGLAHTDSTEMVITLDSPLKGLDMAFWNEHADELIRLMGREVGKYLVPMGDNPEAREKQEQKGLKLRDAGVKLFTFANEQDWFVRSDVAVLREASQDFEGSPVQLRWNLWHAPVGSFFGDLIAGHGQVLVDPEFLEYLVGVLPPS